MKYKISNAENLLSSVTQVNSFQEVQNWDSQATSEIKSINTFLKNVSKEIKDLEDQFKNAEKEFEGKNFFVKTYSTLKKKLKLIIQINDLKKIKPVLLPYKEKLEYWVKVTPDNIEEGQQMIIELQIAKKEYELQKKELKLEIKQIKVDSRNKSTQAGKVKLFTYDNPKLRQAKLQTIREQTDQKLSPYESALNEIERELISTDRLINWITKIIS